VGSLGPCVDGPRAERGVIQREGSTAKVLQESMDSLRGLPSGPVGRSPATPTAESRQVERWGQEEDGQEVEGWEQARDARALDAKGRIFHGSIADAASAIAGSLRGKLRLVMAAARRLSMVVTACELLGPAEKRAGE
jgi:hypothetical protein